MVNLFGGLRKWPDMITPVIKVNESPPGEDHDKNVQSKYIMMYLDANNLHGWAMSQHLLTGNFRWMADKEISKIDLEKYGTDGKKGLI